jgi:CheY-like chemotaxis protein
MQDQIDTKKKYIIVAEDDPSYKTIFKNRLIKAGYRVEVASDGQEALEMVKKEKPDLVLLDMMMPIMTGFEFLEEIRKDEALKDLNIIVVSNLGFKEEIKRSKDLGITDYWIKSEISIQELLTLIEKKLL